ncbi:MAG: LPS export ABC transporter ATP-binding protein [Candidatus Lambdaproteobacteria bacterium]|nr:LPS export ABC transporter ATP-binding protein [Candidatus Lambdaproteobacteria bacterium]
MTEESATPSAATPASELPQPVVSADSLQAHGLVKAYRGRRVVDGVSIEVHRGEIVGLLGPNGAGKTTTFYMIAGLIRPDHGHIYLGLQDITRYPIHRRARMGLGYLPQERSVFRRLTVEENLLAVLEHSGLSRAEQRLRMEEGLEDLGLTQVRHSIGIQLSGGESRRVEIARALVLQPAFILLDEPFAGIDPIAVLDIQEIISLIRTKGIGILITDHNVRETLGVTSRTYIINAGKLLVHGVPDELVNNEIARKIYLGEQFTL